MPHMDDDGYIVDDYDEWLRTTGSKDSEGTRGWYDCPEGGESDYIRNNPDWWKSF